MSKKGLDFEKLELFQQEQEEKYTEIKHQIEIQLEEFGDYLKQKTNIKPNAKAFTNWFFDNYTDEVSKKRRFSFKLERKYALEYCLLLQKELADEHIVVKYNFSTIPNDIDEYEHFDTIIEYLTELFEKDRYLTEETVVQLAKEASFILRNQEPLTEFDKVKRSEISTKQESVRYCYYKMYNDLLKKPHIRKILINYLLEKFDIFDDTEYETVYKHFGTRPDFYPL
ncbi:hypothetical protein [Corallibacter sp.]|uniref:hypothetical protein n=1 Tax=Corallibacter sp. TaxID=2038084 RepID=UPI003AB88940